MKTATAIINMQALRHNINIIKKIAPNSKIIAVIKANAYGHGMLKTAQAIKDLVDTFGISHIQEAIKLRNYGIKNDILLLEDFFEINDIKILIKYNIHIVLQRIEQIKIFEKIKLDKQITAWMKLDTGLHRLGIPITQATKIYNKLINNNNFKKPINILSHFSCADELNKPEITNKELMYFNDFIKNKPGKKSIAASSGILLWPLSHLEWVRPGIMLYGISPQQGKLGKEFGLLPVMTLQANLIAITKHYKGEPIGYGGTWISNNDTYIGIISIGYADGYPRNIKLNTPVLINGRKVPIVGRVSMDMTLINLGINCNDKVNDLVTMWGDLLPVEEIATYANTSNYDLTSRLTSRIQLKYINEK